MHSLSALSPELCSTALMPMNLKFYYVVNCIIVVDTSRTLDPRASERRSRYCKEEACRTVLQDPQSSRLLLNFFKSYIRQILLGHRAIPYQP